MAKKKSTKKTETKAKAKKKETPKEYMSCPACNRKTVMGQTCSWCGAAL